MIAFLRRLLARKNPMLSDPRYAEIVRREAEARKRHGRVWPYQRAKSALVHDALRRAVSR